MLTSNSFLLFTGFISTFPSPNGRCKPTAWPSWLQSALHPGTTDPGHRVLRTRTRVDSGKSFTKGNAVTIQIVKEYLHDQIVTLFQVAGQDLSSTSQQSSQELSPTQLTPVTLAQSHTLQTSSTQQQGPVQHTYIPGNWNYRGYCESFALLVSYQSVWLQLLMPL